MAQKRLGNKLDLLPLGFLILIVLMSGGIAVLADNLGRRLGKKRIHVRGLRPKHVAQIGTFIAGILVSLVTILVVALASSDVRHWIKEGSHAITQLHAVNLKLSEAQQQTKNLFAQMQSLESQKEGLSETNQRLKSDSVRTKDELDQRNVELAHLNTGIGNLRNRIGRLQVSYQTAKWRIRGLNDQVELRQRQLVVQQTKLQRSQFRLANVDRKLIAAQLSESKALGNTREAVAQKLLTDNQNQELLLQQEALTRQVAGLEKTRDDARQQYEDAKRSLQSSKEMLDQTLHEMDQASADLAKARTEAQQFSSIAQVSRFAPMIYRAGDEVARVSIEPGLSFERAEYALASLLRQSRQVATALGAQPNGPYPVAGIFQHKDDRTERQITTDEIQRELIQKIAGAPEPMVLVAVSSLNAFKGEPVSLEVQALSNPLIYKRNTVVAESRINGRKDPAAILRELSDLGAKVRNRAKQDKMIPRNGADELYGAVSTDEVLKLVNQVKASERFVQVRAITENDTRAGDPLKLRFAVH